jgi:mono/diheme cytochrome c family protein
VGVITCTPGAGGAAEKIDMGQREYYTNCAICHGPTGKGDGPFASQIKARVPDLTVLSKNNSGVFPVARVYEVIDGRQHVMAHGSRDMPIWGDTYKAEGAPMHDDFPYNSEAFVRGRILLLIDYLYRIQAK